MNFTSIVIILSEKKYSCEEFNDDKRPNVRCSSTCVPNNIHAVLCAAGSKYNDSRELPSHKQPKVTSLIHSNHIESTETYSAPFQVKREKKKERKKKIKRIS